MTKWIAIGTAGLALGLAACGSEPDTEIAGVSHVAGDAAADPDAETGTEWTVFPRMTAVLPGGTMDLEVIVGTDSSRALVLLPPPTWTSRNEAIATVSSDGVVTGHDFGQVWIVATIEDESDSALVAVSNPDSARTN